MIKQWSEPFNETLFWTALALAGGSLAVLFIGGGLAEFFDSRLLRWVTLLLTAALCAPCAGMVIGADTCRPGDTPMERSTHGFIIGCSVLGGLFFAAAELVVKLG